MFKADFPIHEAQIVQEAIDRIVVRVVPADGWSPEHAELISERLRDRLGQVEVSIDEVDRLERTSNGKLQAVISKLD